MHMMPTLAAHDSCSILLISLGLPHIYEQPPLLSPWEHLIILLHLLLLLLLLLLPYIQSHSLREGRGPGAAGLSAKEASVVASAISY